MVAATENLSEVSRWHDIAGYSIIAFVFVATLALAYLLGKHNRTVVAGVSPAKMQVQPTRLPLQFSVWYVLAALCWLLFIEIGTASWYRFHESNLISGIRWNVQWPEQATNFRKLKIDSEIRAVLRFDEGDAAAWTIRSPANATEPSPVSCSLYVFRWNPGKNSALLANLHRPDVCLPASGWKHVADHGVRSYPISDSVELPFRHFEFQRASQGSAPQTAHAFYCLSEDRASEGSESLGKTDSLGMFGNRSEWTRSERLRVVLEGRRHLGQQVMQVIFISSEPLAAADAESHLRDLVRDVVSTRGRGD